ncbi:MAG: hypothetical protein KF873_12215 [Gemmataceae bacterium]|nr:hypothetical protein [Gemmataceae bacterium]
MNPMNPIPQTNTPKPVATPRPVTVLPAAPELSTGPIANPARLTNVVRNGLIALTVAAVAAIGWQLQSGSANESNHSNWQQVREASARPHGEVRWQSPDGAVAFLPAIGFGDDDRDAPTTVAVRAALLAGDDAVAQRILAAAIAAPPNPPPFLPPSVPASTPTSAAAPGPAPAPATVAPAPAVALQPTLTEGMKAEIRRGDADFFHLYLYDCCDEDGDIVDVLLNGQMFQQVKLTNRGATITIPVAANGSTKVELRGVRDGGGGITIGCRTSRGHGFLRAMTVGETQLLGTVRK